MQFQIAKIIFVFALISNCLMCIIRSHEEMLKLHSVVETSESGHTRKDYCCFLIVHLYLIVSLFISEKIY
jgi:hypothetical protein